MCPDSTAVLIPIAEGRATLWPNELPLGNICDALQLLGFPNGIIPPLVLNGRFESLALADRS